MPEINSLEDTGIRHRETKDITLDWTDPQLKAITRIRFLADSWRGPFDLSYCLGVDREDRQVRVRIPCYQIHASGGQVVPTLVRFARADGVYLRGLCGGAISDVVSLSW